MSSLYTDQDIILNQDGSINKRSRAVQSGEIKFCIDGKVDKRCKAIREGKLILDSNGNVDSTKMGISNRVNPDELGTSVLRHPNEQRKYREQSRSTNKDEQHASHVIDLEVAKAILSTKPGTHLTEERLHEDMKPLNQILRMRSIETNLNYDKDIAQRIIQMVRGEKITVTRGLEGKINQMKDAMNRIPQEQMNPSLQYIKNKLNDLSKQCH